MAFERQFRFQYGNVNSKTLELAPDDRQVTLVLDGNESSASA
jgi:hypothetical protein